MWIQPTPSYLEVAYHYVVNHVFRNVYLKAMDHLIATCIISTLLLIITLREYMHWRQRRHQGRPSIAVSQITTQLIDRSTHPGPNEPQTTNHNNSSEATEHLSKSFGHTKLNVGLTNVLNPAIVNNSLSLHCSKRSIRTWPSHKHPQRHQRI